MIWIQALIYTQVLRFLTFSFKFQILGSRRGRDLMVVGLTTAYAISDCHHNIVVSSNPAQGEVYSIQHYVIKFVSDLRQVGGFLRILRFPSQIKLTTTEILLKVALNTIIQIKFICKSKSNKKNIHEKVKRITWRIGL
jgi:hypothetical protein